MIEPIRRAPWTAAQLRAVLAIDAIAAVVIVVAAIGSDGAHTLTSQVLWLNMALVGLGLVSIAHGGLFLAARRSIGQRIGRVGPLEAMPDTRAQVPAPGWLWITGTQRAHQPGCQLVRGKLAVKIDPADIRARGLRRCEACG
jgi:hypothetical protein